jgi:putative transcriptional regulator
MDQAPYSHMSKGSFLIASPELDRGLYSRSVILLCEHNPGGSFGLVINKPLNVQLPEEITASQELTNPNIGILSAGTIQPSQMMLLHSDSSIPDQTLKICEGVFLGGDLEFLQEHLSNKEGPHIRLCFGYSAWGAGQLEREFLAGAWFLHPASELFVFHTPPQKVWRSVLRSMGGKYATLAMIPDDLSLN